MSEDVYILIKTKSTEDKNMVVDYIVEGEQNDYVPDDLATWSFHSLSELAKKVEDMQVDALIDASASYFMEEGGK